VGESVDMYAKLFISFSSFQKCYCSLTPWDAMKCGRELIGVCKLRKCSVMYRKENSCILFATNVGPPYHRTSFIFSCVRNRFFLNLHRLRLQGFGEGHK